MQHAMMAKRHPRANRARYAAWAVALGALAGTHVAAQALAPDAEGPEARMQRAKRMADNTYRRITELAATPRAKPLAETAAVTKPLPPRATAHAEPSPPAAPEPSLAQRADTLANALRPRPADLQAPDTAAAPAAISVAETPAPAPVTVAIASNTETKPAATVAAPLPSPPPPAAPLRFPGIRLHPGGF